MGTPFFSIPPNRSPPSNPTPVPQLQITIPNRQNMGFQHYSEDIKSLAIQMVMDGHSHSHINRTLRTKISYNSFARWKALYIRTNRVVADPATYKQRGQPHVLSDDHLMVLKDIITHSPALYLDEIQQRLNQITGLDVSRATVSRELKRRLGLFLLVTCGVHQKQSLEERVRFVKRIANIPAEYLVFIDESGVVGRDATRKKSWAPTGTRTVRETRYQENDHWTILPAVCEAGMIAGTVVKGPVERVHVELFLARKLQLPVMNSYPGPNLVLILDNAKIHHGGKIEALCKEKGILLIYLPAYSPDLNPIKKAFNCMKKRLQREQRWRFENDKCSYILGVAGRVITRRLMQPLIVSSGYVTQFYWYRYNLQFPE